MNLDYPVDALVSYHYYKRDNLMAQVAGPGHLRLIGDSGAFSAYTQGSEVKLPEYAAWIRTWRDHLCWVAALDVIGDPTATFKNWATMRDQYGIEAVPTLHAGGAAEILDQYAREGVDYVGLGGLVGIAPRAFRWMVHVMRYARDHHPGMRFHAWGVTNRKILDALPVYSADSSGLMGQSYRYGRLRVFDPATQRDITIVLNGKDAYQHTALLQRIYGIEPGVIAKAGPANRAVLGRVAVAGVQKYAAWLQARHKVTPPTWGIREAVSPAGPALHCAETTTKDLLNLAPEGPRVHVTTTSTGALSKELLPEAQAGPRMHVVDTDHNQLKGLQP